MARLTTSDKEATMTPQESLAWNARRGDAWTDLQPLLDGLFSPFEAVLTDAVISSGVCDVLDIGCGTGATTLAFGTRLAPLGSCTGIDISRPMLDLAQSRATAAGLGNVRFVEGDAQCFDFPRHAFDAVTSRFGIMFFKDPVRAFANIRRAVRPNGVLTCVAWRSETDNPFMVTGELATGSLVQWPERAAPTTPGQFAFADAAHVERILGAAGWCTIEISPINVPCSLPKADLAVYARRMGRVGMVLPDLDQALQEKVESALDDAFASFVTADVARFDSACWLIRAHAT
jgi:SAM-dependent methyltransferase